MKIYLNTKFLHDISKEEHELLISEEQKEKVEQIRGLLDQDIRFCTLVTGYRGTGKSSLVHYALKEYEDKNQKKFFVIYYNAARYKNYKSFLRRFVRELYFVMNSKGSASDQLKKMYYQTFYDIKEYHRQEHLEQARAIRKKKTEIEASGEFDLKALGNSVAEVVKYSFPVGFIVKFINGSVSAVVGGAIWVAATIWSSCSKAGIKLKCKEDRTKEQEEEETQNSGEMIETLYDKEIAEHYIFDELQNINNEKEENLIVVLDELDKVEDEELDKIFHDLKPLFLSCDCNFILIAGRNMDRYLFKAQKDTDNIAKTIFTNKVYIPLSTVQDMMEFAEQFFCKEKEEFYSDEKLQYYCKQKIFESRGVKRAFINAVISESKWDEKDKPYVEVADTLKKEELELLTAFEKIEDLIGQEYNGPKRDELLQCTYSWIEKMKENQHNVFSEADITGNDEEISKDTVYSNLAERLNLAHGFFKTMIEENVLVREGETYQWKSELVMKESKIRVPEEVTKKNLEYIEMFRKQWDEIRTIMYRFAVYNGLTDTERNESDDYEDLLHEMVSGNEILYSQLNEGLSYLRKLYAIGVDNEDINEIIKFTRTFSNSNEKLLEQLMYYTVWSRDWNMINDFLRAYRNLDIVCQRSKDSIYIFFEIKYSISYTNAINSDLILRLVDEVYAYRKKKGINEYQIKIVVFTKSANEKDMHEFDNRTKKLLSDFRQKDQIAIVLIPFNEYDIFKSKLDSILDK